MNSAIGNTEESTKMALGNYALDHAIEDIFATKSDGTMVYANGQFRLHHGLTKDVLRKREINKFVLVKKFLLGWVVENIPVLR